MARIIKDLAHGYNAAVKSSIHPALASWTAQQCNRLGLPPAVDTLALTAEASHRQFYRRRAADGSTIIIMDSPPTLERNTAFVELAELFSANHLPVPHILAQDLAQGYLLLSDVGDRDLFAAYEAEQQDAALEAALHWLRRLQSIRSPHIPLYTAQRLRDELDIFSEWFAQAALQVRDPTSKLQNCFDALIAQADAQRKVCVHRDYHCRNLLWAVDGTFGIVDFQDALHGPLTYDLASLLHDCYYTLPEARVRHWREQFRQSVAPHVSAAAFTQDCDWMALQRQLKAIGIFARLALRDGKLTHLRHVEPTLAQAISIAERYPRLQSLSQWLGAHRDAWPAAEQRLTATLTAQSERS